MASPASGGDNSAAVAMDVASLSPEELEKIPGLKCESIEETEQRIPSGTVKHAIFQVSDVTVVLSAMLCMLTACACIIYQWQVSDITYDESISLSVQSC